MQSKVSWILALAAYAWLASASAQSWPTKPVSLIVGTPPGGAIDAYVRTVGEHMSRTLGQQVLVENKPGANGNISAEHVMRAPADGYTVWVGTQSMTEINPSAFDKLRWSLDDFVPLIKGVEAPLVLVAHPSVRAKTVEQLGAWAKANPGKAAYASFSPGTPSHFLGFQLGERLGVKMTHIPYKGSAPQIQDMLAGHVLLGFSQIQTTLAHIQAGKLIALATTGAKRWHQLPEVPTFAELGMPEFSTTIWFGLLAPKGTPPAARERLLDAALKAHKDEDVKKRLAGMGFDVPATTGQEFLESIRAGQKRWAKLVQATGFKAD
jgi:tripartite-type tricarboxylate transporter receptor subunit TctC